MSGELQPWGGDVWVPRFVRRLFGRADAGDSPERMVESGRDARHATEPGMSVADNVNRVMLGGWAPGHPGNRSRPRRDR
jgi:hypothetical protein